MTNKSVYKYYVLLKHTLWSYGGETTGSAAATIYHTTAVNQPHNIRQLLVLVVCTLLLPRN